MSEEQQMTAEDAKRIVAEERQHRERECMQAIDAVLKQYRCRLNIIEVRVNGKMDEIRIRPEAQE